MARSFDDSSPIYLQIAEEIRLQILDGSLAEGQRLTSTTEYATRYRINPATANKAVALLVDEGLVAKQRGIGMFVLPGARERLTHARRTTWASDTLTPALKTGLILGLTADEVRAAVDHLLSTLHTSPAPSQPTTREE